ncbi:hypothetical protein [Sphingomonas sp. Leaf208]|nr:hypothetical protein [Sphingomonas sp. Leaf208]
MDRMRVSGATADARRGTSDVAEQPQGGVQHPGNAPWARAMLLSYIAEP